MLRTALFVLILVWLLVASAIAFVPIVGGQDEAKGSLTITCDRDSLPRGVDTLIRCTYVARNDSDEDWQGVRLTYQPLAGAATPNRYFFFRYGQGETVLAHEPSQTTYAFPWVSAGASAQMQLDVIVNSEHDFGVTAVLSTGDEGWSVDTVEQRWPVVDASGDPPLYGSLVPILRDESGDVSSSVASWTLVLRNTLSEDLVNVRAEVFAPGYGVTAGLLDPTRTSDMHIAGGLGPVDAGGFIQQELRVETRRRCAYANPAMIVSATTRGGGVVTGAILPEEGATLNCQTLEVPLFPATGQGLMPEGAATPLRPLPAQFSVAIATSGAVLALLGIAPLIRRLRGPEQRESESPVTNRL